MSGNAYRWAIDQDLKMTSKAVLLALAWYADESGENSHPGASLLSTHTGMTVRSVRRALSALEASGLIRRQGFRKKDGREAFSRSSVYILAMRDGDSVSPSTPQRDSVSPEVPDIERDSVSPSTPQRDSVSPFATLERDSVSPYYHNSQNTTHTSESGRARPDISEALEMWRLCSNQNGLVPRATDQTAILGFVNQYTLREVLDAIAAIAEDEHPRPRVFWIRDRIEQHRKRRQKRQQQQQRSRAGVDIEGAWSRVDHGTRSQTSLSARLKTKGTR